MYRRLIVLLLLCAAVAIGHFRFQIFGRVSAAGAATMHAEQCRQDLFSIKGTLAKYWLGNDMRLVGQAEFVRYIRQHPEYRRFDDPALDAFGHRYVYEALYRGNHPRPYGFKLTSKGADGKLGTADDIGVRFDGPS